MLTEGVLQQWKEDLRRADRVIAFLQEVAVASEDEKEEEGARSTSQSVSARSSPSERGGNTDGEEFKEDLRPASQPPRVKLQPLPHRASAPLLASLSDSSTPSAQPSPMSDTERRYREAEAIVAARQKRLAALRDKAREDSLVSAQKAVMLASKRYDCAITIQRVRVAVRNKDVLDLLYPDGPSSLIHCCLVTDHSRVLSSVSPAPQASTP